MTGRVIYFNIDWFDIDLQGDLLYWDHRPPAWGGFILPALKILSYE